MEGNPIPEHEWPSDDYWMEWPWLDPEAEWEPEPSESEDELETEPSESEEEELAFVTFMNVSLLGEYKERKLALSFMK